MNLKIVLAVIFAKTKHRHPKLKLHNTGWIRNPIIEINAEGGTIHKGKLNMLIGQIIKKHV